MTVNFIGPYVVRIPYESSVLSHTMQVSCDVVGAPTPGTAMDQINVYNKGAGQQALDEAIDDFMSLVKVEYPSGTSFGPPELYYVVPGTEVLQWISTGVDTWVGDSGSPEVKASELILTFRTYEGGVMRLTVLETINTGNTHEPLGGRGIGTYEGDIWRYVVSDANWILARDTSYPIAPLYMCQGQNEVLWKRHYRS